MADHVFRNLDIVIRLTWSLDQTQTPFVHKYEEQFFLSSIYSPWLPMRKSYITNDIRTRGMNT